MSFIVLIPARLKSSRLPNKPLLNIKGKTLIQRVHEKAILSKADKVYVVTDSDLIATHCKDINAKSIMTDTDHQTGTDRVAEAASLLKLDDQQIVVNLQGDEPFTLPEDINKVANLLDVYKSADMGTLYTLNLLESDISNKNRVKVLLDANSKVVNFSRDKIDRINNKTNLGIHLGIYSYRVNFLNEYVKLQPSINEKFLKLEQLRALDANKNIFGESSSNEIHLGIDTPEDIILAEKIIESYGI
ncbi:MAG: 3-deoxy-manno-octulosonate cytidylyltransferase [SAR86 cluster bacterium]|jgi:3-deoxy-manno-octulosonate cytidylyltransferase (CMP-KDO synthetase)|nr:3-deoxy-manno-octulosonate cytidylyltransferase [SAR86 cluster bacterium]